MPGYGVYADAPGAVFLGKDLVEDLDGSAVADEEDAWAS